MVQISSREAQAGIRVDHGSSKADMRPILYLDIIGTLVLQEGKSFRMVPFAREFLAQFKDRVEMIFVSELSEAATREIALMLGLEIAHGVYSKGLGKVSGIDFARSFIWVDDAPTSRDLMRLAEERCSGCLVTVNGKDGVTRSTLNKVINLLDEMVTADGAAR